ncbi:MAG TPA: hypothetical protein VGH56_08405, partial [Solirubrobacteraceae bacterium]
PLDDDLQAQRMSMLAASRFLLDGRGYGYHVAKGNRTWDNERAVEIPIVWDALQSHGHSRGVLEVGNVLGHYFPIDHPVLDRDERHRTVTWNQDVLAFEPPFAPELVLSISTLEHVGMDQTPRDPTQFRQALDAVLSWLAPGGRLLFTVPLGYNRGVGEYLDAPHAARSSVRCLRRITPENLWAQAAYDQVRTYRYNRPFTCANAIAIVECTA